MEFVSNEEIAGLLRDYGYDQVAEADDRIYLSMRDQEGVVHLHMADQACEAEPRSGARSVVTPGADLHHVVDQIIHRLNLHDLLLIPVGKWRKVFDAVAFSLAANEAWQEIDAAATVELNTRDPLLCEPADFPLVIELVRALIADADASDQGLMITSTAVPILGEIVPTGALRVSVGNQALADEVLDAVSHEA